MSTYELLNLYPHNIRTCEKIREAFDNGKDTVSIIKATGTGKSYIGLNLALEHKNEKVIWLVPTNAIKEHIEQIIFNNPNLNRERDFPNLEIRTYSSLVDLSDEEIEDITCDLLIVDELHHIGAPVWGEKVNTLIYTHPNLKIFGMSAYSVRDRGTIYERDMTNPETEEIFSNTVVDRYDLYDAIIDGVLPLPIAKTVLTEDSSIIEELQDALNVKKEVQKEIEAHLENIIKTIHKQNPIKEIIQEAITENGKYIYFCPVFSHEGINDIDTVKNQVVGYIKEKYPGKRIAVYQTTSNMGRIGDRNRYCFYHDIDLDGKDATDTIRIMFAKNQYNEGVHAPNVNGVFLGRKTESDIVALEQIGRSLSARENINQKRIEYSLLEIGELKELAQKKGIIFDKDITKENLIELLLSPIIIDLTGNIEFLEELEINLKTRAKTRRKERGISRERIELLEKYQLFMLEAKYKDILDALLHFKKLVQNNTWDDYYKLALTYYNNNNHSEIPWKFKTKDGVTMSNDEDAVKLGVWCDTQRSRQEKLSEERRKKLEQIKFRFEKRDNELEWKKMYNLALIYYNHYGHSDIPMKFITKDGITVSSDEDAVKLGVWCDTQRRKQEKLSEERRKKLEQIEFRYEGKYELEWEKMYNLALIYYNHYGHSDIPMKFITKDGITVSSDEDAVKLGAWCDTQRSRQEKLSEERRKKLEQIKFRFREKHELNWLKMYDLALIYYNHYGHSNIPKWFKTKDGVTVSNDEDTVKLGAWCDAQRSRQEKLSEERRKKLEQIKFRFEKRDNELEWEKMYNLALMYYNYYGHSDIPTKFRTKDGITVCNDEDSINLGYWCDVQRSRQEKLSEERRKKLEQIKFRFEDKYELEWLKMYELAKAYYNYYGHSEIPKGFRTKDGVVKDNNGIALGLWCDRQRQNYRKYTFGKHTKLDEKFQKLELIEFRLHVKRKNQALKIELCNIYGIVYNNYKVLDRMSYQELYAKIMFLLDNKLPLEIYGKLHPIFTMCNENMMINYGISKEELITNYYINKRGKK